MRLIERCGRQSKGKEARRTWHARMQARIVGREAENAATVELLADDSFEDRFAILGHDRGAAAEAEAGS
jgi:hypothetical protein